MPSRDKGWLIERFPEYDDVGNLIGVSYGCGDIKHGSGYGSAFELLNEVQKDIDLQEVNDLEEGNNKIMEQLNLLATETAVKPKDEIDFPFIKKKYRGDKDEQT